MRISARLPFFATIALAACTLLAQNPPINHMAPYRPGLSGANAQLAPSPLPPDVLEKVNAAAEAAVKTSGVPSDSLAIVKDDRIVDTHAYGDARLQPLTPAQPDMRYSIGSISKQFTAVALLMLQDEGKLSLDDKVGKYLPDLARANDVTIREVLSHTAGYQDFWPEDYVMTTMMEPTTTQHILDVWGKKPLDFEPGTQWQYSNTNYVIAGRIFEIVARQDLFPFLQKRIFTPLDMQSVMNQDARHLPDTDAQGYYRHALGPLRPAPKEGFGWMFAAGELAMTAHDLALWDIAMINQDPRILSKHAWNELSTEVKLKDGKPTHYALGVQVATMHGQRAIFHSGEVSGFVAMNVVLPDLRAAIVSLTNLDASGGANDVVRAVAPIVFPEFKTTPKPAATAAAKPEEKSAEKAAPQPEPKESAETAEARKIFTGLQQGKIDRSLMTQLTNNYFTPEALDDYQQSLAPLGAPVKFEQVATELRGGMTFYVYQASFANGKAVEVTTYVEPDGKIEQYLVSPS
jgi:CubicO group peptidase (beta-lactamase class C family)